MSPAEQRDRMRSMRSLVREFNVYRWAGRMLLDATRMRNRRKIESQAQTQAQSQAWPHRGAKILRLRGG